MTRPRLKTGKPIMIYCTPEERERLERAAESIPTTLSSFCLLGSMARASEVLNPPTVGGKKQAAKGGRKGR